jgi:hypothetical protein
MRSLPSTGQQQAAAGPGDSRKGDKVRKDSKFALLGKERKI